ncbi:tRNA-Thr(GGU) m(6)t(6)A37 methyltransferase TsaA [Desulfonauticus submarinus]|uniref:tRNA-Thr(GGU) m(6)t(6)A37 methyltransferase TsaA n=1 Tax=Desulfonauticus submarinus TaxID=206665 RepID=A0A1H0FH46_9BACT|nr:tRNA (N6-threonylcarbamoyladenosine(37)-N6)-methyltransferase TrmO [Desulfonauticus submarinus]SDN93995.1 tRNA-Thr(GGU) m(6)t(6)A37 methyltransferase TsaA [Desulfonauticus submarinus]
MQEFEIKFNPIGFVKSSLKKPLELPPKDNPKDFQKWKLKAKKYREKIKNSCCQIVIYPQYQEMLEGIHEFSHIIITYWPHLIQNKKCPCKIRPMGIPHIEPKGIFATCSPIRPNSILISTVKLLNIENNILTVLGFEALHKSPVLDIKPYMPYYHHASNFNIPNWVKYIEQEL